MTREMTAESVLASARNHWSTENNQHWQLDVSFGEDASKIHERTATKNIATVRRCCFNAHKLSNYFEKESIRRRAELAGLDEDLMLRTRHPLKLLERRSQCRQIQLRSQLKVVQLELAGQNLKAKCRIDRHKQMIALR